ncbi:hypothetical protein FRC20_006780 [Serendipita sp. 405]|nr:hypothetical protein FRC20_006780 [Serendipita sp. 405]
MIKEMDESHPQRAKLLEAEKIAGKIAQCESDDQTKRATIMYCLERTIEGFPPGLISNGRRFIDCIDVEDIPTDIGPVSSGASGSSGALGALHCTLFLFDDRLIIVKRPNGVSSGRSLARLGEIEKLLRTNGLNSLKKSGMSCKGVVDVLDVTATDAPGTDIHIYLESPPQDQTDRWNGRPFRSYAVVLPPAPLNLDPTATQAAKKRFLENIWTIQALYRVKNGRCVAVRSEEKELENRAGRATQATGFYNIYQRTPYLGEARKPKVVVHVDPSREADAIPFGIVSGPFVIIRLQPMAGGLCRYNVTCNSPDEAEEEHILHSEVVPTRIMQTINQFGLFSFRTSAVSRPSTPTASTRSRAAVFGLDVLSRTLMGGSKSGEVFSFGAGNSETISGTKKSRGAMSRNSTQTMTATSLLLEEDSLSIRSARKLTKRGKSPGRATDENTDVVSHAPPDPLARRSHDEPLESVPETVSIFSREPPFADTIYEAPPKLADLQAQDYDVAAALDETIAAFSPPSFPAPLSDEDTPTKPPFEFVIGGGVSRTPTKSSTSSVEPLSIKKKSSIKPRRSGGSFRRIPVHDPPSPSPANNVKHTPSMVRSTRSRAPEKAKDVDHIVVIAKTTKEDLSSARRAVKRIKQEVEILRNDMSRESTPNRLDRSGAVSPSGTRGIVRSPPTRHIVNKAAEARMEEMRQMIERRGAHGDPSHRRSPSSTGDATSALDPSRLEQWTRTVESLVDDADKQIAQAIDQSEGLVKDIALLAVKDNDDSSQDEELEKLQAELKSSQRQTDVLKQLLQDATAENEVLYSTFNQELEEMYQNVHLPEDQAWSAMTNDLIAAKQTRNKLSKENFHYKQKLRIAEQRNEELLAFLQAHGLEPPY